MINTELYTKIEKIIESKGLNLYDIETLKENDETLLRISLFKKNGVTLDDCEEISTILSPLLDVELDSKNSYILEVSSPGIERVLKKPNHFKYSINELIEIKMNDKSVFKGILKDYNDENLLIDIMDSKRKKVIESRTLPLQECKKIKTIFEWENIK